MIPGTDRILPDLKIYTDLSTQYLQGVIVLKNYFKTIFIRNFLPHLVKIEKSVDKNNMNLVSSCVPSPPDPPPSFSTQRGGGGTPPL